MSYTQTVSPATKKKLIALADRYETPAFLEKDPSQFMHRYTKTRDQEIMAFIAANLAFGNRKQILLHTEAVCASITKESGGSPADWILSGAYKTLFKKSDESFYRMMSHSTMLLFCSTLKSLLKKYGTFGEAVKASHEKVCKKSAASSDAPQFLHQSIAALFPKECAIVCHGKTSCAKRLQMFLRWMVRDSSPVDLGIWSTWYSKEKLLMPLDTHVMQEASKLNLIPLTPSGKIPAPSLKLAVSLTQTLATVFPGDPTRADFALFGLGVDEG